MNGSEAYAKRFAKVFAYIDEHLDEAMSVEQLGELVNSHSNDG